jgi:oxygen-independent coproporphyrinogen-3 oxidase
MLTLPLSLYIHLPWCVRKCPYCDFNSHELRDSLPEELYVNALMDELDNHLPDLEGRQLVSIFFGGGTPSLFSAQAIDRILTGVDQRMPLGKQIEITLEANPGTFEQARFQGFRAAGVNRLSIGVQSLQDDKLKILGRIHDRDNALRAIECAKTAGFDNFNIDLMYGLPGQRIDDALQDIETALSQNPTHLSWYQLTIEPNTLFYHQRPVLPEDDMLWDMQLAGQQLLSASGFHQYEVSAYSLPNKPCQHNLNYWEFGDYLGIGAGAHSKLTNLKSGEIVRFAQVKHPKDYLERAKRQQLIKNKVGESDLVFEFMLNALRLTEGVPLALFTQRTGLPLERIQPLLNQAKVKGLLVDDAVKLCPSVLGKKFLNDLIEMFLS